LKCRSFDKTKFSCFTLPPTQHHSFFRNKKFVYAQLNPLGLLLLLLLLLLFGMWLMSRKNQYISKQYIKRLSMKEQITQISNLQRLALFVQWKSSIISKIQISHLFGWIQIFLKFFFRGTVFKVTSKLTYQFALYKLKSLNCFEVCN